MKTTIDCCFEHRLFFTDQVFDPANDLLRRVLACDDHGGKALMFFDQGLVRANPHLPQQARRYFASLGPALHLVDTHLVPGGEVCKNDPAVLQAILQHIHDAGIDRKSFVLVAGGGAVLDVVGYAAAIAHRGLRLVRLPSTTLAQDDSGVGIKNGVNAFGKKNFLGAFAVPWAVINDRTLLRSLSLHHWVSGFSEALKVAMIRDAGLYRFICRHARAIRRRDEGPALAVIERSAHLHYRHIVAGGDPFEQDQARPLDFGHWAAHRLEAMSDYRLTHGHAVAVGLAIDTTYARLAGLLDADQWAGALHCLTELGLEGSCDLLDRPDQVLQGLEEFREHLGGRLTVTFPHGIGRSVDVHEIDLDRMHRAIDHVAAGARDRRLARPA